MVENIGMAKDPQTAEDNTHPATHHGIELQTPFAGRQAGAFQYNRYAFTRFEGTMWSVGRRGSEVVLRGQRGNG